MRIQLNSASGLGDRLAQRVADMAAGRTAVAAPRNAATVMLLRPCTPDGVEVLMLRRTAAMKFAPGAYVFPGGSVDEADFSAEIGWHGPPPADFGAWLGCSAELAGALVCAAVRETFEESGVLLAGTPDGWPLGWLTRPGKRTGWRMTAGTLTLPGLLAKSRPDGSRRPAGPVDALDHARGRAAAVRHVVLRGGTAGRPGGDRSPGGGRQDGVAAPGGRDRRRTGRHHLAAAAHGGDAERIHQVR